MKYLTKLLFICLVLACAHPYAADELKIIIDRGIEKTLPIAIIPFAWERSSQLPPVDFALTIANDLARSGRFSPMREEDLPQRPTALQQINFKDWRLLGMETLVIGELKQTIDGNFEVEFRLVDIYRGTQIAGFRITSTLKQLRRTAHRISDIVFEKLTGIKGAFDTRIAYITVIKQQDGAKHYNLQIADADGFNPQVLLDSKQPLMSPAWSPDGTRVAYVSFEDRNSNIYIQDILTGRRSRIAANEGINSAPAWSPDGSRLAVTLSKDGNPEIYLIHLASQTLQRITFNRAIDTEPNWNRDGARLAFTSDRGGTPQIYTVEILSGRTERLTFEGAYNARPRYAPDGKTMAMIHATGGAYQIALMDIKGGFINILTNSRLDESPSFAPNGSMIMYATAGRAGSELAAVSVDGRVHQRLALQIGEVREPAWGPFPPAAP
jgi:TolB protein